MSHNKYICIVDSETVPQHIPVDQRQQPNVVVRSGTVCVCVCVVCVLPASKLEQIKLSNQA